MTVGQGTFTTTKATLHWHPCGPGETFVNLGQGHVHRARNEETEVVSLYVMCFDVPPEVTQPVHRA